MKKTTLVLVLLLAFKITYAQKFLPPNGQRLMFIGQDMNSVNGYKDSGFFPIPSGVTTYINDGNTALRSTTDWGGGPLNAVQSAADNPNSVIAIGYYLVGATDAIGDGQRDNEIRDLANYIAEVKRPVFLRIGYEFDGAWNGYSPESYIKAYKRVVDIIRQNSNAAKWFVSVWQSSTSPIDDNIDGGVEDIAAYYPGNDYVDWVGMSWFLRPNEESTTGGTVSTQIFLANQLVDFAKSRNKPVFIAESAPQGYQLDSSNNCNIGGWDGDAGQNCVNKSSNEIWNEWFSPFFNFIYDNPEVQAVAYINANWDIQGLWKAPYPQGYWGDTRIETNTTIRNNWNNELNKSTWLNGSSNLVNILDGGSGNDDITSTTAPSSVTPGTNATVTVDYIASTDRDIIVYFQDAAAPFTVRAQAKVDVSSGSGNRSINIAIPANLPLGNDLYQFNTIITTNGGDYSNLLDEDPKGGVDAINNTTAFKTSAQFDFGTINSPVFNGYTRVHKNTRLATYGWTRSLALSTKDRGTPNVNNLNRDFVYSKYARTFETSVENGTWEVKITSGDIFKHDNMQIKAEGKTKVSNFTVDANKYVNQIFYVLVQDGKLSLEFSDQGGSDQNWVINRVVLTKRDLPNEFKFDLGEINSPVFSGYTRVHKNTRTIGYRWPNSVAMNDKDRGSASGQNTLNRDIVYSRYKRTFETNVENGLWEVLVTFGDIIKHDNMRVRCEGVVKLDNITNNENQYFNKIFTITVRDGILSLEFSDEGGSDANWAVSRIILKKINSSTLIANLPKQKLEEPSTSNFVIYPNPAKNTMRINLGTPVTSACVNIIDTSGRILKKVTINDNNEAIDISAIPSGMYFIQIHNGDKMYQKSLIKN